MFTCVPRRYGASTVLLLKRCANISEGADSTKSFRGEFGGQIRGDKECPFSGVNGYGRVWREGINTN